MTAIPTVDVRFTNDSCSGCGGNPVGGGDRNLFVNSVTVGSRTVAPNDPSVSYLTPPCNSFSSGVGALYCNGDMLVATTPQASAQTITVNAYGSPDYSIYPHMQLLVNGTVVGQWDVTGSAQNYTVSVPIAPWAYDSMDYLPFGEQIAGDTGTTHKFTSKERDAETGLDFFGARYLSGAQGRFTSVDPENAAARLFDPQRWNAYSYVRDLPTRLTDPDGRDPVCNIDGFLTDCGQAAAFVRSGAAEQCPNNICEGVNGYNLPVRFVATAQGSYYSPLLPGVWSSATQAGEAAVGSTNGWSIAINTELGGNVYRLPNGKYSWVLPHSGGADRVVWNPGAIPSGTTYAGSYHDHGAFDVNYDSEQFSPLGCNGGLLCDIGIALLPANRGQFSFLGTPLGRIELFDPAQVALRPFGCVLVGPAVVAAPHTGTSSVDVPKCP